MSGFDDPQRFRRDFRKPYTGRRNIPTIQEYRRRKDDLHSRFAQLDDDDQDQSTLQSYLDWARGYWYGEQSSAPGAPDGNPEKTSAGHDDAQSGHVSNGAEDQDDSNNAGAPKDTTEVESLSSDPKARGKELSRRKAIRADRQVTDPITHLPVKIHNFTDAELNDVQEQDDEDSGTLKRLLRTLKSRTNSGLSHEADETEKRHQSLDRVFPPPEYQMLKEDLERIFRNGISIGIGGMCGIFAMALLMRWALSNVVNEKSSIFMVVLIKWGLLIAVPLALAGLVFKNVQTWAAKQARGVIDDDVWDNKDTMAAQAVKSDLPESCHWLNKMLRSIWPLINPDLFESLTDVLEDVMQASLPSLVRMVQVEDIGQGSESIRILGIKWLPKGAAAKSLTTSGDLEERKHELKGAASQDGARRAATTIGQYGGDTQKAAANDDFSGNNSSIDGQNPEEKGHAGSGANDESVQTAQEAEEGDFMNFEVAFAYKTNKYRQSFRQRAQHAHLFLSFYLFGGIKLPVWVELRGVVGTMRCRMQLCPDPPFVALTTITLLGQPNVDISCFPLSKRGLNIMDVPLISNFVQDAVDAAASEYVAPKSLTLDLKAMLAGDDFKTDTSAHGVLIVRIKRAFDFTAGDAAIPIIRAASSDAYVTVSWAKFGKPIFSTRVITRDMEPHWEEEAFCLVGPEEIDAEESLRLQLWDSDRLTADDDLGRIEVSLKQLMTSSKTNGNMCDRIDPFRALKAGECMPGRCEWSVGYFPKAGILKYQLEEQRLYKYKTEDSLRDHIYRKAANKLRESSRDEQEEIEQQKQQDFHDAKCRIISGTRPAEQYPCGILSIQIHQIVGLATENLSRSRDNDGGEQEGEEEQAEDLPSSYATIILNGKKIYRTRVKPQNSKPFFNAGCERYIRDWRTAEAYISVRDARLKEKDPLLGLVYLPLATMFRKGKTSQFNAFFPLVGGIGYGRARISVVFRSVEIQPPLKSLGWDVGNVRVEPAIVGTDGLSSELQSCKLVLRTPLARKKMYPTTHPDQGEGQGHGVWHSRHQNVLMLPVRKRYAVCLMIEFRSTTRRLLGGDKTPGYAVLWLQDLPDDEKQEITLTVYKGDMWRAALNTLPDHLCGEKQGTIKLNVTFVRGMSKWHRPLARGNLDLQNVFELLEVAADCGITEGIVGHGIQHKKTYRPTFDANGESLVKNDNDASENEDSDAALDSDDDSADDREVLRNRHDIDDSSGSDSELSADGDSTERASDEKNEGRGGIRGLADEVRAYRKHKGQLHRKHRGIMQWKPVRTADWLLSKTGNMGHKMKESMELKGKEPQIETEV